MVCAAWRFAVHLSEDGDDHSYAGVFESILDVEPGGLLDAVAMVRQSLQYSDTSQYGNGEAQGGGVIVQELIDADYAGVLFTEHPMQSGAI